VALVKVRARGGGGKPNALCVRPVTQQTKLYKSTILPRIKGEYISLLSSVSLISSTVYCLPLSVLGTAIKGKVSTKCAK